MDADAIAAEIFEAFASGRSVEPFSRRLAGFGKTTAYAVTPRLRAMREADGDTVVGRKIGFTNRNIWPEYGVFEPIWGYMYDATVHAVEPGATIDVSHLPEPRIEPEIVLGLGADLTADMSLAAIVEAIEWVAHGFEIVQSIYPGWRFSAADCIADQGLHGGLYVGPKHSVSAHDRTGLALQLSELTIGLSCNSEIVDTGTGANVLDGPVQALRHLVATLTEDSHNPPLRKGEMITTGTLTRAFPVQSGECWSTVIEGVDLPGMSLIIA